MAGRRRSAIGKKPSLRQVKKEATERALADAAFDLANERGLDRMTVEDVVERAGCSRRTFANHFSCKEEAVVMAVFPRQGVEEFTVLVNHFAERTTPLELMFRFLHMQLAIDFLAKMRQLMLLTSRHRTLEPHLLMVLRRLETELQAVLRDLFHDQYPPGYYQLLTGAVSEGLLPVMDGTVPVSLPGASGGRVANALDYDAYLDTMFFYLRHGF